MTRLAIRLASAVVLCVWLTADAEGHHSISAAYDDSKRVTVEGIVDQFQFINPHPFVVVNVIAGSRPAEAWRLELDNRSELARIGVTAMTFRQGDRLVVIGSPSRTQPRGLYVRRLERQTDGLLYEQIGGDPRITTRPR